MSGAVDIRKALETRLAAIADALDTQWENKAFVPTASKPYQQVNLLLADPDNVEVGPGYQENGIFQITLRYPIGNGPSDAMTRAQALRDWFYKGLQVAANGLTVTINRTPTIAPAVTVGDRYCVPVKVRFYANVSM